MRGHFVINKGTELFRIPLDALVFVSADGNYSTFVTLDGRETLICLQLGKIEAFMSELVGSALTKFIRLGRGFIINLDYVNHIDISRQVLIMSDGKGFYRELSASREALITLKEYVLSCAKKG